MIPQIPVLTAYLLIDVISRVCFAFFFLVFDNAITNFMNISISHLPTDRLPRGPHILNVMAFTCMLESPQK